MISNLYPPFYLGGYEIACRNVANALRDRGHEVIVLTSPSHAAEKIKSDTWVFRELELSLFQPFTSTNEAVRLLEIMKSFAINYTNTTVFLDWIKRFQPECIYFFNLAGIGGLSLIDAANKLDYPWALHLMDRVPEEMQNHNSPAILALFNAIGGKIYDQGSLISMSKHLVREIEDMCGFRFEKPIHIVPGWADAPHPISRRTYSGVGDTFRFVTAGAIHPHKGIDIILDAARRLIETGTVNFAIDIYGEGLLTHYVDKAKQLNISDKVRFLGSRSQAELAQIYKTSDAFLFPTWEREPFGFAPLEAAAQGCVPIITRICGAAERLIDRVHCLKIPRDIDALCGIMRKVCSGAVNLDDIGWAGQQICRQDLSFDICLGQIEQILADTIDSKRARRPPTWEDTNLAFLKYNLSKKMLPCY
jgi:glycogen synthase